MEYTKITISIFISVIFFTGLASAQSYLTPVEKSEIKSLEQMVENLQIEKSRVVRSANRTVKLTGNATLRSKPSPVGGRIGTIESGTKVKVIDSNGEGNSYILISHGGLEGWVNKDIAFGSINVVPLEVHNLQDKINHLKSKIYETKTPTCAERLGGGTKAEIACDGIVVTGMNKQMVREAWGKPKKVNTTISEYGTHEQWVYGSLSNRRYVYFRDGILTTIQK